SLPKPIDSPLELFYRGIGPIYTQRDLTILGHQGELAMTGRIMLAGLVLAAISLATGCCHHSLCGSSSASQLTRSACCRAPRPCCPPAGVSPAPVAIPAAPVPVTGAPGCQPY